MPQQAGDCYLLLGYQTHEGACLAYAYQGHRGWWFDLDDGDLYPCWSCEDFYAHCPCEEVVLIRRGRDGIGAALRARLTPSQQKRARQSYSINRLMEAQDAS
jgi:hypothetical protein